jgi:replication factor A1
VILRRRANQCSAIFNDPVKLQREWPVPICQCVQIKTLGASGESGAPERYRLVLSDVKNFVQSMLSTRMYSIILWQSQSDFYVEANHVVHEGKLKKGSVVRLKSYQANSVKGKRYIFHPSTKSDY